MLNCIIFRKSKKEPLNPAVLRPSGVVLTPAHVNEKLINVLDCFFPYMYSRTVLTFLFIVKLLKHYVDFLVHNI